MYGDFFYSKKRSRDFSRPWSLLAVLVIGYFFHAMQNTLHPGRMRIINTDKADEWQRCLLVAFCESVPARFVSVKTAQNRVNSNNFCAAHVKSCMRVKSVGFTKSYHARIFMLN